MGDSYAKAYYNYLVKAMSHCRETRREDFVPHLRGTIERLKNHFANKGVNISRPCSGSSEDDCWIFSHLAAWNQIVCAIDSELKEETPGLLALCALECKQPSICSEEDTRVACIAVHWLLKEHHCIGTVKLFAVPLLKSHAFLFCNGLSLSKAVKSLTLSLHCFKHEYSAELSDAIGRMGCLEKFKINAPLSKLGKCFEDIGVGIGSTNTVTELSVLKSVSSCNAATFLNGSKSCTKLKYLRVSLRHLSGAECLLDMLRSNPDLEKLKLHYITFSTLELSKTAEELTARPLSKLQELQFHDCRLKQGSMILLGRALHGHEALSSLKITHCSLNCTKLELLLQGLNCRKLDILRLDGNIIRDPGATTLAKYIRAGQEFGVVSLKNNMLSSNGVIALLEASIQNGSNTEFYFGYLAADDDSAHKITRILETEGVGRRVGIVCNSTGISHLGRVLRNNTYQLNTIWLDKSFALRPEHLIELFGSLTCNRSIEHLKLDKCIFDTASVEALGCVFLMNKTLKSFESGTKSLQSSHMVVLFENLARNISLTKLVLHGTVFDRVAADAFVSMLKSNRTLAEFRHFVGHSELLKIVTGGLQSNCTLLVFGMLRSHDRDVTCDVREVLRRNRSFLNKATKFVLTQKLERSLAVAFEKVYRADSLVSHLEVVDRLSNAAAKARIRHAARFIRDQYLVLSGIVKERLECFRNACGTVQIDQLSAECLQQIFSYLKLEDVQHSDN